MKRHQHTSNIKIPEGSLAGYMLLRFIAPFICVDCIALKQRSFDFNTVKEFIHIRPWCIPLYLQLRWRFEVV